MPITHHIENIDVASCLQARQQVFIDHVDRVPYFGVLVP